MKNSLQENKDIIYLLKWAITICLLTFGFELTHFTLSIDEEIHSFDPQIWRVWLAQGRWGMAGLTYFLPYQISTLPFLATAIFCAGLSISSVLLATKLMTHRIAQILFVSLTVSCPIWPHLVEFNTISAGIGLGLVACSMAVVKTLKFDIKPVKLTGINFVWTVLLLTKVVSFSLPVLCLVKLSVGAFVDHANLSNRGVRHGNHGSGILASLATLWL